MGEGPGGEVSGWGPPRLTPRSRYPFPVSPQQLSLFDVLQAPPRPSGRILIAAGARAAEAALMERLDALLAEARRDPSLLKVPVRIVVPSRSLRLHVAAAIVRRRGRSVAGVSVQTLFGLAAEILERSGEAVASRRQPARRLRAAGRPCRAVAPAGAGGSGRRLRGGHRHRARPARRRFRARPRRGCRGGPGERRPARRHQGRGGARPRPGPLRRRCRGRDAGPGPGARLNPPPARRRAGGDRRRRGRAGAGDPHSRFRRCHGSRHRSDRGPSAPPRRLDDPGPSAEARRRGR